MASTRVEAYSRPAMGSDAKKKPLTLGVAVFNLFFWPYLALSCAVLFVPALAIRLLVFPRRLGSRMLHLYTSFWGSHYLAYSPGAGVKVSGREKVPRDHAVI